MTTYRKRIGYGKLGRSISFTEDKWGFAGDQEAPQLLLRLADRNPDIEWVIVGRNDLDTRELRPNITNPWSGRPSGPCHGLADKISWLIGTLDGVVLHAGQHGTSHMSIPESKVTWNDALTDPFNRMTTPQDWSWTYGGFLIRGLNNLGDRTNGNAPVVWIVTDPRNYVKGRDIKWPTGCDSILSQYHFTRQQRHERFRDTRHPKRVDFRYKGKITVDRADEIWIAEHHYRYGGLELMILPDNWSVWGPSGFHDRQPAGIASTSNSDGRAGKEPRRSELIRDYLLATFPGSEIFGKWDATSLADVPKGAVVQNNPSDFPELLNRWRLTLTLPVVGSAWSVAKPFQTWAARCVTFFVGNVDDQGWILPSRRQIAPAEPVGEVAGVKFYSVRDDWTESELRLARWVRVETPEEFTSHATVVAQREDVWESLTKTQLQLLHRRWDERLIERSIEQQLKL